MRVATIVVALLVTFAAVSQEVSPDRERGFDPQKAYAVDELGVVNLFNGNLNVSVPIGIAYPVSSSLSYGLALQYAGNNWNYEWVEEVETDENGNPICDPILGTNDCVTRTITYDWAYPSPLDNAGFGWRLHLGRMQAGFGTEGFGYETPDGSIHAAYGTLHAGSSETSVANTSYTRDGTYYRRRDSGNTVYIDRPDGTTHEFNTDSAHSSKGRVIKISDRYGNWVQVDYNYGWAPAPTSLLTGLFTAWRIWDSTGREHFVYVRPTVHYEESDRAVSLPHEAVFEVRLTMPNGPAIWKLHYVGDDGATPAWASLPRPDSGLGLHPPGMSELVQAALLERVEPPVGNSFFFTYADDGVEVAPAGKKSGILLSVTLPTGGSIGWEYATHAYPAPVPSSQRNPPPLSESVSVISRTVKNAAGVATAFRAYDATWDPLILTSGAPPTLEKKVTVTDYDGGNSSAPILAKTTSFFSFCPKTCNGLALQGEYGLPLTRKVQTGFPAGNDGGGRYLSTITYGPGNGWTEVLQTTYIAYEADVDLASTQIGAFDFNRRVFSQRTFHKNTNHWTTTHSTEWDGFGHYRTTTTETSPTLGGPLRSTKKNYTPHGATVTTPPATAVAWLPDLFDSVEVWDGAGPRARTEFCFDSTTGFLQRRRILRDTTGSNFDLLMVATQSGGNVQTEKFYGGDNQPLGDDQPLTNFTNTCTSAPPATARYGLTHSYTNGVRSRSKYDGVLFDSLDLTVDASGLVTAATDSSDITTYFQYDGLGRLKQIRPCATNPGSGDCTQSAWTEYEYGASSGTAPASVKAIEWSSMTAGKTLRTDTRYYYDGLGRMIQQRNWMQDVAAPGANDWSVVQTTYDPMGRPKETTVAVDATSGNYAQISNVPKTSTVYDALGRVTSTTLPDGKVIQTNQSEAPLAVTRTVMVETAENAPTAVSTREVFDGLGRLVSVEENSASVNKVVTDYEYDEGDRLKKVDAGVQERLFHYDLAGLLTSEQHPEIGASGNGTIAYTYDARGHVEKKDTPNDILTMTYDSAERLIEVGGIAGVLQQYTYDTAIVNGLGKMATAKRYNRLPQDLGGGVVTVTETFNYGDRRGRLSQKTTSISSGETFVDNYEYDSSGALEEVTYPACTTGCSGLAAPPRTVTNTYKHGFLRSVSGYVEGIQYHPNGLLATQRRVNVDGTNGPLYEQDVANGMARPSNITLSGDCQLSITTQPPETSTVAQGAQANISVTGSSGTNHYEWFVLGSSTPVQSGSDPTLRVLVNMETTFFARISNGTCTVDSRPAKVSVLACTPPNATISTVSSIGPGVEADATVVGTGTYSWTIENGTIISAANTKTIRFRANCSGTVVLHVAVTSSGCTATGDRNVSVIAPVVTVAATPNPVQAGSSTSLTASATGTGPWTFTWADDIAAPATRSVTPSATTTYSVTKVNGCSASWGSVTVNVTPPPSPINVTATYAAGKVTVSWSLPPGANVDSFAIDRCDTGCASNPGTQVGTTSNVSFEDTTVLANRAYVYRVRARKLDTFSAQSAPDLATTVVFPYYPVVPGVTPVEAASMYQMRAAVNALRTSAGLAPGSYSDAVLSGVAIRGIHIIELRTALNAARANFGFSQISFTDPTLVPMSTDVRAVHFNEIMGGVR